MVAYDRDLLHVVQDKLGTMIEIAVLYFDYNIDDFMNVFVKSKISKSFEKGDIIKILGKSSLESFYDISNEEDKNFEFNSFSTPEYWCGYVISYMQWKNNISFEKIISKIPCSKLINYYFPYHEMDITKTDEIFIKYIKIENKLKLLREKNNLSQSELALLSEIPIRNIRAYEQGKIELYNAKGETLYKLSKALKCSMEELLV